MVLVVVLGVGGGVSHGGWWISYGGVNFFTIVFKARFLTESLIGKENCNLLFVFVRSCLFNRSLHFFVFMDFLSKNRSGCAIN